MKYFAGILPPSRVCTELGKNFPPGPSPSPSIVSVESGGFFTRCAFFHAIFRAHHAPEPINPITANTDANRNAAAPAPSPNHFREPAHDSARKKTPATHNAMCAYNHCFNRCGVPILTSTMPKIAPSASKLHPRRFANLCSRQQLAKYGTIETVSTSPATKWKSNTAEYVKVADG